MATSLKESPFSGEPRFFSSLDAAYEIVKTCEHAAWRLHHLFILQHSYHYFHGGHEYGCVPSYFSEEHFCLTEISRLIRTFPLVDYVERKPWLWPWDRKLHDYLNQYKLQAHRHWSGLPVLPEFQILFSGSQLKKMVGTIRKRSRAPNTNASEFSALDTAAATLLQDFCPHFLPPPPYITQQLSIPDELQGVAARLNLILQAYGFPEDNAAAIEPPISGSVRMDIVRLINMDAVLLSCLYNAYMAEQRGIGNRLWIGRMTFCRWAAFNNPKRILLIVHLFRKRKLGYYGGYMYGFVESETSNTTDVLTLMKRPHMVVFGLGSDCPARCSYLPRFIPELTNAQIYFLHQNHIAQSIISDLIDSFKTTMKCYGDIYGKQIAEENINRIEPARYLPYMVYNKTNSLPDEIAFLRSSWTEL